MNVEPQVDEKDEDPSRTLTHQELYGFSNIPTGNFNFTKLERW